MGSDYSDLRWISSTRQELRMLFSSRFATKIVKLLYVCACVVKCVAMVRRKVPFGQISMSIECIELRLTSLFNLNVALY